MSRHSPYPRQNFELHYFYPRQNYIDSRDPLQNLTHAARESMQVTSVTPPMYLRYPCQPHYLEDSGEQLIKTQKSS